MTQWVQEVTWRICNSKSLKIDVALNYFYIFIVFLEMFN